jgi:hypothetical protein
VSRVASVSRKELEKRREEILAEFDTTFEQLRDRAEVGTLLGDEWEAWDALCDIGFLLGDD